MCGNSHGDPNYSHDKRNRNETKGSQLPIFSPQIRQHSESRRSQRLDLSELSSSVGDQEGIKIIFSEREREMNRRKNYLINQDA